MTEIRIGSRTIGDGHAPLIIAEIGIAHHGSRQQAERMILAASKAGAHVVKFQCHLPSCEMVLGTGIFKNGIATNIQGATLSPADDRYLKTYAESLGLIYLSTPFSVEAVDRLAAMDVCAFKVGSGELTHAPLLRRIAAHGKPVLMSTGMGTFAEIDAAIDELGDCPLVLMHCVSIYPTPYDKVGLGKLAIWRNSFNNVLVGISDHSIGICTALGAVALGACVVEKHFMLEGMQCPDADVSITPSQLAELTYGARAIHLANQPAIAAPHDQEAEVAKWARHSVTTLRPMRAGDVFTPDNLGCKRPGTGIAPARLADLMGKLAARELPTDTQITEADVV